MSEHVPPAPGSSAPTSGSPVPGTSDATASTSAASSTNDDRTMGMLAHLLGILLGFLGPLIIWLIKKDQSAFVNDQGKEALNFQITVLIAVVVSNVLIFVVVGCFLLPAVVICNIIFCIMGAIAANKGQYYRYPVALRLIK